MIGEIPASQRVPRDDDAGHGLEDRATPHDRPRVELPRGDRALAGGLCNADQIFDR